MECGRVKKKKFVSNKVYRNTVKHLLKLEHYNRVRPQKSVVMVISQATA